MGKEGDEGVETKVCSKCGEEKALEEFGRDRRRKDGRRAMCRACSRAYDRARGKKYYEQNKEKVLARIRNYRANNLELVREQERNRRSSPEARAAARERYKNQIATETEEEKERRLAKRRAWYRNNKHTRRTYQRDWYHGNKPALKDSIRRSNRRGVLRKYGLTEEDYRRMLSAQSGKCAVCSIQLDQLSPKNVHIDHCHETGAVRGILCRGCNQGIGQLRDSKELLTAAIDYLESTSENTS